MRKNTRLKIFAMALATEALLQMFPVSAEETDPAAAEIIIRPGDEQINLPEFEDYEAVYGSAFATTGGFTHQVRLVESPEGSTISILNLIPMPGFMVVDHRGLNARTMHTEYFFSPFFGWGEEFVAGLMRNGGYSWVRVPLNGDDPIQIKGELGEGDYFEALGFSPTLAALMPMPVGTVFKMPTDQPQKDGTVASVLTEYEVVGREDVTTESGLECACWVIEQRSARGDISRLWVARKAPFLFRRHRDVGGERDFVSDLVSFRYLKY